MYPDRDTITQLLLVRRMQQHVFDMIFQEKVLIYDEAPSVWSLGD